jgi:hypothetical protein
MCAPLLNVGNNNVHVGMVSIVVITLNFIQIYAAGRTDRQVDRQTDMVCHVCVQSVHIVQICNM